MNHTKWFAYFFIIGISYLFFSCSSPETNNLPEPVIKLGTATISGKIEGFNKSEGISSYMNICNPIGNHLRIPIEIDEMGNIQQQIPIETSPAIGYLLLDEENSFVVSLKPDEETKFEIITDEKNKKKINILSGPSFISGDLSKWSDIYIEMSQLGDKKFKYINRDSVNRFIENPLEYIPYGMKYDLGQRLESAVNDTTISEKERSLLISDFKLLFISQLFNYTSVILELYDVTRSDGDTTKFIPKHPDKSYYVFLKEFDLNNPQLLYTSNYSQTVQIILRDETLGIPKIKDTPINEWQREVKAILTGLVGFDKGLFYDVLTASAYMRQFIDEMKPLSDKQKENITNYFNNGEIAKILFKENEEIAILNEKRIQTVVNTTPEVPKEKLIDAIVSNYKGKVVLVDFWATWCGPCVYSIQKTRPLKSKMKDKNVVFVYITNTSSPTKLWKEKIEGIGGEHYYISEDEWIYLCEKFDFSGIPTYLFFGTDGKLNNKITGGIDEKQMQEMIEELL